MTALALFYAACGLGLNAALAAVEGSPLLGRFPPWFYAAVGAGALALCALWLALAAAALSGLSRLLGGAGGYARGYQAAAMLFALAPAQAFAGAFPLAWTAPSLLFAWAGAGALAGLLRASLPGALAVCAALAGLSIGGQAAARWLYARHVAPYAELAAQSRALIESGNAVAALQTLERELAGVGAAPAPGRAGVSGLDLLRGPAEAGAPPAEPAAADQVLLQQGDALRASAEGLLQSVAPLLDNPAITRNLDAQGRAEVRELRELLGAMQAQSRAQAVDAREQARTMQRLQELSLRLMSRAIGSAGSAAPAERKGR